MPFKCVHYISIHSLHAERDRCYSPAGCAYRNFNPLSPCGERRNFLLGQILHPGISIHSLHAERDVSKEQLTVCTLGFQSTLSMRRETDHDVGRDPSGMAISIHSLHAERDFAAVAPFQRFVISIHSLHAERDRSKFLWFRPFLSFQSTLSMRRETLTLTGYDESEIISIHSLHAERDFKRDSS